MPARTDTSLDPGGQAVQRLARRLRDAVGGHGEGNGNGSNGSHGERTRRIAVEVGAALLAEANQGTADHSDDVVLITEAIGERMGITGDAAADLLAAARLHDIGKAWLPGALLDKAGPLTHDEWVLMRQHTVVGEQILTSVDGLREVGRLVRHSHERWDGGGYPDGLAASDIPLGSRIIFCADAFHAIRCDRPYRAGRSAAEAVTEINRCAGTQFDPHVAGALEQVVRERKRRAGGAGGSSRLVALLMCLVIGGAGTAIARSGLTGELPMPAASVAPTPPPPGCGTADCSGVAAPVGGLNAVGAPGPRPVSPGLPGRRQGKKHGAKGAGQGGAGSQGKGHKGKGNRGKSAAAKEEHANRGQGHGSQGSSEPSGTAHSGYGSSGSSSPGAGGSGGHASHGSGGHPSHSGSGHGSSGRGSSTHGSASHGGGGGGGGSPGNAGGNSGAHGK